MDEPWRHYAKWNKPVTKEKYCMISLTWGTYSSQIHRERKNSDYQGLGEGKMGSYCLMDRVWEDQKVLKMMVVMAVQQYECI